VCVEWVLNEEMGCWLLRKFVCVRESCCKGKEEKEGAKEGRELLYESSRPRVSLATTIGRCEHCLTSLLRFLVEIHE